MIKLEKITLMILAFLALFYSVSGIVFFVFPQFVFDLLPEYYGLYNYHFIKDAGIAFFSSGIMLFISLAKASLRVILAVCGSLFVLLHSLFHVQMILSGMVPREFYGLELFLVIIPAILLMCIIVILCKTAGIKNNAHHKYG